MSAIFGLIHLDGRPLPPGHLEALRAAQAARSVGVGALWSDGPAGMGQVLLASAPECAYELMPWASPDGGLAFCAAGRLDNRGELMAELGISPDAGALAADTTLMLRAYERWGDGCAGRLIGDWAFAAWRPRERRLTLARDQFGVTGLYYYAGPGTIAFASSMPALLALPDVPRRINELQLARLLAIFPGDGADTMYQGVMRLPPAHMLVAGGDAPRVRRYWRMEDAPEVRLGSDEDYVEAFLERYEAAVRARLRGARPVGSTLSAGLDSGSVTALAARQLRAQGRGLVAFTAAPAFPAHDLVGPRALADEWPVAQAAAAMAGVAEHIAVRAGGVSPSAALAWSLRTFGEPQHAAANMHWLRDLHAVAQSRGIGVMLTGQVGNGGVSWAGSGHRALDLLRAGRAGAALRALGDYRAASGRSWPGAIRRQLLGPLRRGLRAAAWRAWPTDEPWRGYAFLSRPFARRIDLVGQMRAAGHDPTFSRTLGGAERRIATLMPASSPAGAFWHALGAPFGVEARDPTADIRLIQLCLGLPDEQHRRGDQGRLLIRRAMAGLLPAEVLAADRFGRQAADIGPRMRADHMAIEGLLRRAEGEPLAQDYLDLPAMRRAWSALQRGLSPETNASAGNLLRALDVGLFILTLAAADGTIGWDTSA